jgi:hypothetical protein
VFVRVLGTTQHEHEHQHEHDGRNSALKTD